jgi:hypothetical protein
MTDKNISKTIPLSTEEIQQVFLDPSAHYTINLNDSKLKGESFVTYIANMQINCTLETRAETPSEEKCEVLRHYLTFRQSIKCDTLLNTSALLLLRLVDVPVDLTTDWMSFEEMDEFIANNEEIVIETARFVNSAPLFVAAFSNDFREKMLNPAIEDGSIVVIDDPHVVGVNALNLFSVPNFTEIFIAGVLQNPENKKLPHIYYKAQVERLQYDRKTVFDIFLDLKESSFLMSFVNLLFAENEDGKEEKLIQSLAHV